VLGVALEPRQFLCLTAGVSFRLVRLLRGHSRSSGSMPLDEGKLRLLQDQVELLALIRDAGITSAQFRAPGAGR
jgi:hypothetical protein